MNCRYCKRTNHEQGALLGMLGAGGLFAAIGSEWGQWGAAFTLLGAILGGALGWWVDRTKNAEEHEVVCAGWQPGEKVILQDGRRGTLGHPRGCACGPNGEPCWDINLDDETCIQAHGGTFHRLEEDKGTE